MHSPPKSLLTRLADQPVVRVLAYYILLAVAVLLLYQVAPDLQGVFSADRFQQLITGGGAQSLTGPGGAGAAVAPSPLGAAEEALIAMAGAYLLMLPVAWIYIFTRRKKGFRQSLVQTQVILPVVVAAVVILVKNSLALAFAAGAVVAAVTFRHTLQDTKDAIYIFLSIGVGLAAGVQVMSVAVALSVFFNLVILLSWWTDFGRMPAQLEAPVAERRLQRLRAQAERPGALVSMVDSQLLKSMTPEQLDALATRARRRRRSFAEEIGVEDSYENEPKRERFDSTLRVQMTPADAPAVRQAVEQVLGTQTKRWQLETTGIGDPGREVAVYKVRFKKSIPSTLVIESIRRGALPRQVTVELV